VDRPLLTKAHPAVSSSQVSNGSGRGMATRRQDGCSGARNFGPPGAYVILLKKTVTKLAQRHRKFRLGETNRAEMGQTERCVAVSPISVGQVRTPLSQLPAAGVDLRRHRRTDRVAVMGANLRKSQRHILSASGMIYDIKGNSLMRCIVRDVSATGARLELALDEPLPKSFLLSLTKDGMVRRMCRVAWQLATVAGVRFSGEAGA
jgi:PilZ domain-containing protein